MPFPAFLAHKLNVNNVWLVRTVEISHAGAEFAYRVPETIDVTYLEVIEVARQALHSYAHLELGVPLDFGSLLTQVRFHRTTPRELSASGEVSLTCAVTGDVRQKRFAVAAELTFADDCGTLATCQISGMYVSQQLLLRLHRTDQVLRSLDPSPAGRSDEWNEERPTGLPDDHESLHVTGMELMSAAVDAVREGGLGGDVDRIDAHFVRLALVGAHLSYVVDRTSGAVRVLGNDELVAEIHVLCHSPELEECA